MDKARRAFVMAPSAREQPEVIRKKYLELVAVLNNYNLPIAIHDAMDALGQEVERVTR